MNDAKASRWLTLEESQRALQERWKLQIEDAATLEARADELRRRAQERYREAQALRQQIIRVESQMLHCRKELACDTLDVIKRVQHGYRMASPNSLTMIESRSLGKWALIEITV